MRRQPGRDQRIRELLTRTPEERSTDELVQAVVTRTRGLPQRGRSRWRDLGTRRLLLAGAVGAAAVLVLVVGATLRNPPGSGRQPGGRLDHSPATELPISLPRPTSLPTDGSCEPIAGCLGILAAGSHQTAVFRPTTTFTTAGGWVNREDRGGIFDLRSTAIPGDALLLLRDPVPLRDGRIVGGVGSDARALAAWLAADPRLSASGAASASIGGLNGMRLRLAIASGTSGRPLGCATQVCVDLFTATDPATRPVWQYRISLSGTERATVYLLDAPPGVIMILVDSLDGRTLDRLEAAAAPILASMRFAVERGASTPSPP
ncbi:MAG: hypothetical protein DLM71_03280 [Chloroflexi bacterium]|nr:MAG: hypothetical protein DLM71_03280 [Chloroflexota bacterium]